MLEEAIAGLMARRQLLECAANEWQARAEAAVVAGDDATALHALEAKRLVRESLAALDRELAVNEKLLSEWRLLVVEFQRTARRGRHPR
jgi:phage shock protein A